MSNSTGNVDESVTGDTQRIPEMYRYVFESGVLAIADEVRKIDFIIEELGHTVIFEVDEYEVIIKRKEK